MTISPTYVEKIREVYPDVVLDHLQLNSDGMVNDVVVVNRELVCRFVREAGDAEVLAREATVLSVVHDRVELSTPRLEHLEVGFASYRYIPGEPLSRNALARLSARGRSRIISELGLFHAQLHGIPAEALTASGVSQSASVRSRTDWLELYDRVRRFLFPHLWTHQLVWVDELFAPVVSGQLDLSYTPTLIHGDLGIYHIFHDPERQALTGVIDFGVAGLGDPHVTSRSSSATTVMASCSGWRRTIHGCPTSSSAPDSGPARSNSNGPPQVWSTTTSRFYWPTSVETGRCDRSAPEPDRPID